MRVQEWSVYKGGVTQDLLKMYGRVLKDLALSG